ncbi:MAG: tRNA (N6-threonylcarbamoyladenosine(37)-N6)-methyltransferase TrmO [Syntrophomonadaceae bacterium]
MDNAIVLQPVGVVHTDIDHPKDMPVGGELAQIEIFPEYQAALTRIEENSHIWVLMWFHLGDRNILTTRPVKINPDLPEFGVFALRAFSRPNPIAITRVKLEKREGNRLWVSGLDAVNGTPVLDIKPYYEADRVFSPRTSYIRPRERQMRMDQFLRIALAHHQEECADVYLAARMAVVADEYLGQLTQDDVIVSVQGSRCLADAVQGVTNARLANPARLNFIESDTDRPVVKWSKGEQVLTLTGKHLLNQQDFWNLEDQQVMDIEHISR